MLKQTREMGKPVLKIKGYAAEDIRSLLHSDPVLSVATEYGLSRKCKYEKYLV